MKSLLAVILSLVVAPILFGAQNVKSIAGVALANVKSVDGVAKANVKSIAGVDNTGGGGPTYLVTEGFEDSGDTTPTGWTVAAGDPDFGYTTNILQGTESLRMNGAAATVSADTPNFGDQNTLEGSFDYMPLVLPGAGRELQRFLLNGAQSGGSEVRINENGQLVIQHGTDSPAVTVTGMSINTHYRVWWRYEADLDGGAASGFASVCFAAVDGSGNSTRPTSGNQYTQTTTGSGTAAIDQVRVTSQFSTSGPDGVYDRLRVDDAVIGNNP